MRSDLRIRTPEGIVFSYALAGPVARCLACAIDVLIVGALQNVVSILMQRLWFVSNDFAGGLAVISFFIISVGYSLICEWLLRGQTLGKKVFRLRVMDANGLRLQPVWLLLLRKPFPFSPLRTYPGQHKRHRAHRSLRLPTGLVQPWV